MKIRLAILLLALEGINKCAYGCDLIDASITSLRLARDDNGGCVVWFCSSNHTWVRGGFCWLANEETAANIALTQAAARQSLASQQSLYNSTFAGKPLMGDPNNPDNIMLPLWNSVQKPTDLPADGLVVQNQNAYRLTSPTNAAPTFQLAGSVPVGTMCDTAQKMGPLYRVDRTKVVIPKGALLAPAYYALCDP